MNPNLKKITSIICIATFFSFSLVGCYPKTKPTENKPTTETQSSLPTNPTPAISPSTPAVSLIVDTDDNYVAKIADEKITQSEYYFFLAQTKSQMSRTAGVSNPADSETYWNTKVEGKDPKETAKETTLNNLKEYKIQINQAKLNNFVLSEEDKASSKKTLDDFVAKNGGEQALSSQLAQIGLNIDSFKLIYSNLTFIDKYMLSKQKEETVTDEAVSKNYTDKKDTIDFVKVSHVLYLTTDPNAGTPSPEDKIAKAKADADECLAKVNAGADINELARTFSQDPGVKENNGDYDVYKGQMVPEFEQWAFSKNVGETGIVKTSYGFHVMKKKEASTPAQGLEASKAQLQKNKILEKLGQWKNDSKYDLIKNESVFNTLKF